MSAAAAPFDDLLAHELTCDAATFERLTDEEALALLTARFSLLVEYGWDWRTAVLLAVQPEVPPHAAAWFRPGQAASAQLH